MAIAKHKTLLIAAVLVALLAAALAWRGAWSRSAEQPIGLFTTLPILWNETADVGDLLRSDAPAHWAKGVIERQGRLVPVDHLAGTGSGGLAGLKRLVMAQPRPLSPEENVALDEWVRGGGQVLLLADPMLTEDSDFSVGDRRRPQDVVLLTPILRRWGLEPQFDESQPIGEVRQEVMGQQIPVNLPGRFLIIDAKSCRAWGEGVAASCAIGKGRVIGLADAAVLEREDPDGARATAFEWLLDTAFAAR